MPHFVLRSDLILPPPRRPPRRPRPARAGCGKYRGVLPRPRVRSPPLVPASASLDLGSRAASLDLARAASLELARARGSMDLARSARSSMDAVRSKDASRRTSLDITHHELHLARAASCDGTVSSLGSMGSPSHSLLSSATWSVAATAAAAAAAAAAERARLAGGPPRPQEPRPDAVPLPHWV